MSLRPPASPPPSAPKFQTALCSPCLLIEQARGQPKRPAPFEAGRARTQIPRLERHRHGGGARCARTGADEARVPPGTTVALETGRVEASMKIVCATDFTPRGLAAAQIAVDIARRTRGWVELVHVMKPGTVDILALAADAVVLEAEVRTEVEARLARECDRLSTAGVPVTFRVCEGDVERSGRS